MFWSDLTGQTSASSGRAAIERARHSHESSSSAGDRPRLGDRPSPHRMHPPTRGAYRRRSSVVEALPGGRPSRRSVKRQPSVPQPTRWLPALPLRGGPTIGRLVRTAHLQPFGRAFEPVADRLRRFVAAEFSDDRRRHDHQAIKRRQDVLALDQNQVLQRRCVGDDNHSTDRLAAWGMSEFSLTLLTQTRTGLALALEVLNRVFERHAVTLEERIQVVP